MIKRIKEYILKHLSLSDLEGEILFRFEEDLSVDELTKEQFQLILKDMAGIENIDNYYLTSLKKDRVRYFNATKETQEVIRGGFLRTLWYLNSIRKSRETARVSSGKNTEFNSPRHG